MKFYKCDQCGDEFDDKNGMIEGRCEYTRKIKLHRTGWSTYSEEYKIKKTIELCRIIPSSQTYIRADKDLCPSCVKTLEKP